MSKILLIYTGGTIGMTKDYETGSLVPFDFNNISDQIPELKLIDAELDVYSFAAPIDSSDMNIQGWRVIADIIYERYADYDGFVVLHGTDTMAYAASALSFMLQGLEKPIIFTGSQLPIGDLRTDARENLISSIHFAALKNEQNHPVINEICIYFEYKLYRGNRTVKVSSNHFDAFKSPNFPVLAESGVQMMVYKSNMLDSKSQKLRFYPNMGDEIAVLKIYPSMHTSFLTNTLNIPDLKVLIIESFGSGNIFSNETFNVLLKRKVLEGLEVIICSQCLYGDVSIGKYKSSSIWQNINALSARNMTTEATIVKVMHILGNPKLYKSFAIGFNKNMCGEHGSSQNNFS